MPSTEEAVEPPHTFNYADIWEYAAARVPDRVALVCGERRLTFAELDARANRLAHHLRAAGVGPGDFVAIFVPNCTEYIEAMFAAYKLRAVPVNINHRYTTDELGQLLDDSAAVALFVGAEQVPVAAALGRERLEGLRTVLAVADPAGAAGRSSQELARGLPGAVGYDEATAGQPAEAPQVEGRSGDDLYVIYTGGTTGRPKGVVWRQEDAFFPCFGGGDPMRLAPVSRPEELAEHIMEQPVCYLSIAPLMHAAGQWVACGWMWAGSKVVLHTGSLDPERVWQTVQAESVNLLTVVGDAVAKPLLDAWEANPGRWDASALFAISNGGAPLSPSMRKRLHQTFPNLVIADGFGSSETGAQGSYRGEDGPESAARFSPYGDDTAVVDRDLERVTPGSETVGQVAMRGRIPLRYHNDPEKTAATFVLRDGERWVLTGDMATVEADGTIRLLGRGSQCINTGGEKVFPEEVEAVLHGHPGVEDIVVAGMADERWGHAVVAIVEPVAGSTVTLDELRGFARSQLAGYKLPKRLVVVDRVQRSPAGKADLRWADQVLGDVADDTGNTGKTGN